jgi:hypothetical protein
VWIGVQKLTAQFQRVQWVAMPFAGLVLLWSAFAMGHW